MGGVDFFGKRIGPMQMTRLIGAKFTLAARAKFRYPDSRSPP